MLIIMLTTFIVSILEVSFIVLYDTQNVNNEGRVFCAGLYYWEIHVWSKWYVIYAHHGLPSVHFIYSQSFGFWCGHDRVHCFIGDQRHMEVFDHITEHRHRLVSPESDHKRMLLIDFYSVALMTLLAKTLATCRTHFR